MSQTKSNRLKELYRTVCRQLAKWRPGWFPRKEPIVRQRNPGRKQPLLRHNPGRSYFPEHENKMFHDELLNGKPIRECFKYLRSCVVRGGDKPCSWPFCFYVAWERLTNSPNLLRVFYVRTDVPGDGHKVRLRSKRRRADEIIVCAKRLTPLPLPRRYHQRPTRQQIRDSRKLLNTWNENWHRWAAEYQPVEPWPQRMIDRWRNWFGPRSGARQTILASETHLVWLNNRDYSYSCNGCYSYAKLLYHCPRVPNAIRARDLPNKRFEILAYFAVDPGRQVSLSRFCQRVLVHDHSDLAPGHFFGVHSLDNYQGCVALNSVHPQCEPDPMDDSRLKPPGDLGAAKSHKRDWLAMLEKETNVHN